MSGAAKEDPYRKVIWKPSEFSTLKVFEWKGKLWVQSWMATYDKDEVYATELTRESVTELIIALDEWLNKK